MMVLNRGGLAAGRVRVGLGETEAFGAGMEEKSAEFRQEREVYVRTAKQG